MSPTGENGLLDPAVAFGAYSDDDMNHLLLKAQRLAASKTEFVAFQKAA